MESRKVYKSGGSTYVMSLPKGWVKKLDLKEGDSVFLSKNKNSVTIYPETSENQKEVKVDTKEIPSSDSLIKVIIAHYLKGAKTIEIIFSDERSPETRKKLNKILDNLVGIEIIEDIGKKITLEIFIDYERMKINNVLERIKNITTSMLNDLEKGIKFEDNEKIKESLEREKSVDRLYFLILRELNYATSFQAIQGNLGISEPGDVLSYKTIVKSFERISDHIEDICQDYLELENSKNKKEFSEEIIDLITELNNILEKAWDAINSEELREFDKVFNSIREFDSKHHEIRSQIFQETTQKPNVIKYTDIMISLSRIAQYVSDMVEGEININTKRLR